MDNHFLRLPQVMQKIGLSRSEIYRRISLGQFPAQYKIGERTSAWLASEIDAWIAERLQGRASSKGGIHAT